ncbi:MAG: hypothetical protein K8H88_11360 [Sandaracinaceae bacterium]|nr:hypothetical protein [Sandaracinaceae bacterium]
MRARLLRLLAGPELGISSVLLFAGLYTWPFLTFDGAGNTFRFIFLVWLLHIAVIGISSFASKYVEEETFREETERTIGE